ncbi:MAG: MFS transporter [Ktedonobacteraceae bacterium]
MSLPTDSTEKLLPDEQQENAIHNSPTSTSSPQERSVRKFLSSGILAPLKVRDFRLLFGGQLVSTVGDAFYAVALPWLVLTNGGNAQELGIILSAYGIPRIGSVLLGGILSDRLRPRRVMLLADFTRAILVGILALLALIGHPALWQLLLVAIPLGTFEGLFLPASFAMLPEVLEDADLQAGNALNTSSVQLATLVGSGAGGIVVGALRSGVALAIDALSFVVSAISLALIRGRSQPAPATEGEAASPPPAELTAEGMKTVAVPVDGENAEVMQAAPTATFWQFVRESQVVQVAFIVSLFANITFGGLLEVALPSLAHGPLAAGANGYGAILAAFGAGALLGGVVTGMLGNISHRGTFALGAAMLQAIVIVFIPYGGLAGAIVCMAAMGLFNSATNVIFITIMQQIIPRHLLGRIMGVFMFASFGSYPLSVAVIGVIVAHFGPAIIFPIGGATLFLAVAFGLTRKQLREL